MSRYIDADVLKQKYTMATTRYSGGIMERPVVVLEAIDDAPSIDIVRCSECKRHKPSKIWAETKPCIVEPFPSIRCKMLDREVSADDFCSYGEREDE